MQFFLISFLIPMGIAIITSYYFYTKYYESFNESLVDTSQQHLYEELDLTLGFYENMMFRVGSDSQLNANIRRLNSSTDNQELAIIRQQIYQRFAFYGYNWEGAEQIGYIDLDHNYIVYDKNYDSMFYNYAITDEFIGTIYESTFDSSKPVKFSGLFSMHYHQGAQMTKHLFAVSIPAYTIPGKQLLGVFFITIDTSVLDMLTGNTLRLKENQNDSDLSIILTDDTGTVMTAPWPELIGLKAEDAFTYLDDTLEISIRDIYSSSLPVPGWDSYLVVQNTQTIRRLALYRRLLIIVALVLLVSISSAILIFTRKLTDDVTVITDGMLKLQQGHLGQSISVHRADELGRIASGFNEMSSEMKHLVADLYEEKEKVIQSIQMKKTLEMQLLEAQINPHFIYNTLDSISWMAISNEEYEISEMLSKLGEIIRYSTINSNDIVPLQREINWLKEYLSLQSRRFSYSFYWSVDCDDEIKDFYIPKLTLQPIIENAIIHGLLARDDDEERTLKITCHHTQGLITITIADNGIGIPDSVISGTESACSLLEAQGTIGVLSQQNTIQGIGVGIMNTIQRLHNHFGSAFFMKYGKVEDHGTICTLTIAIENSSKDDSCRL